MELHTLHPPMPNEVAITQKEIFLEMFFKFLSGFSFSKAKDAIDKELALQPPPKWGSLVQLLGAVNNAEKDYVALSFIGQAVSSKLFGKKDVKSIKGVYKAISSDLEKVQSYIEGTSKSCPSLDCIHGSSEKVAMSLDQQESPDCVQFIQHLCSQLKIFISARIHTSELLEKMYLLAQNKSLCYEDLRKDVAHILEEHQRNSHHPLLSPIQGNFMLECEVLGHLFEAQIFMQSFHFLETIMALFKAHTKLNAWAGGISTKEVKTSFFSRPTKSPVAPALLLWVSKLKSAITAKVAFYYHDTLNSHQTVNPDLKTVLAKCKIDLHGRVIQFHRKTEALCSCLVYFTNDETFSGVGYCLPLGRGQPKTGLESYPAVFAYPSAKAEKHWPAVVSLITVHQKEDKSLGKICHCYDEKMSSTYFLVQTDPRVTFVVIYECKKSERDSQTQSYISEMISHLMLMKAWLALGS